MSAVLVSAPFVAPSASPFRVVNRVRSSTKFPAPNNNNPAAGRGDYGGGYQSALAQQRFGLNSRSSKKAQLSETMAIIENQFVRVFPGDQACLSELLLGGFAPTASARPEVHQF
jgi:hypothetical protein